MSAGADRGTGNTVVHLAGTDDRGIVRELRLRSLKESPEAFGSTYEGTLARDGDDYWERFLAVGPCFLATPSGADSPLGISRVMPGEPAGDLSIGAAATIISVWVAPEARGTGAGRALIEACIAWAGRHMPGGQLRLDVVEANQAARRLYERCGFVAVGRDPDAPDELVMQRLPGVP